MGKKHCASVRGIRKRLTMGLLNSRTEEMGPAFCIAED